MRLTVLRDGVLERELARPGGARSQRSRWPGVEVSQPPKPARDQTPNLIQQTGVEHRLRPGRRSARARTLARQLDARRAHTRRARYDSHGSAKLEKGRPVIAATSSARIVRRTLPGSIFAAATGSRSREPRVQPLAPRAPPPPRLQLRRGSPASVPGNSRSSTTARRYRPDPPTSSAPCPRSRISATAARARRWNRRDGERLATARRRRSGGAGRERAARASASRCRRPSRGTRASSRPRRSPRPRRSASSMRRLGLARCRRTDEREERLARIVSYPATAAGSGTSSPTRWCGAAAVMRAVTNVPGCELGVQVHDPVRPRPRLRRRPLLAPALDQQLDACVPTCCARALERDRLLEVDQPVEPLLHDLLRDLVRPSWPRAFPAAASTGTCTRESNRARATTSSVSREVLLGLARGTRR